MLLDRMHSGLVYDPMHIKFYTSHPCIPMCCAVLIYLQLLCYTHSLAPQDYYTHTIQSHRVEHGFKKMLQ